MKLTKSKPTDDKKVEAIARLMSIGYTMEEALKILKQAEVVNHFFGDDDEGDCDVDR
jgi:carbamoylphosphate synthase large subunit